jgi:hypothetical protein
MRALLSSICCLLIAGAFAQNAGEKQLERLRSKAKVGLEYCRAKKLNTDFCILIDMSLHSGKKRAYIWDFKKDTILKAGMCSHGCGNNSWSSTYTKERPVFSNVPDSHCSSLGKYKVAKRGYSQWGIHVNYVLHGLESSNSNALKRQIVLHSWDDVSDTEVYPAGTPEGWGCPALSNELMRAADEVLKTNYNCLLWIFN